MTNRSYELNGMDGISSEVAVFVNDRSTRSHNGPFTARSGDAQMCAQKFQSTPQPRIYSRDDVWTPSESTIVDINSNLPRNNP